MANYGGGGNASSFGFQATFSGTLANTALPFPLTFTNMSGTLSGWFGITDRAGLDTRGGGTQTATGNDIPVVTPPAAMTIPYRTPFTLTGSATDANPLVYSWDRTLRRPNRLGRWHRPRLQQQGQRTAVRDVPEVVADRRHVRIHVRL